MSGPRSLVVCIDDFGMHAGVNDAALELGSAGRVTAVGCLVDGPAWRSGASALLAALRGWGDVGLHIDLTEPWAGASPRSLPKLILAAYGGRLRAPAITAELKRQLDAFEDAAGAAPDFVDGHQHVHQLPVIRSALVAELLRRYPLRLPWIRSSLPPPTLQGFALKPQVIGMLGGRALRKLAQRAQLRQNRRLLGVYNFSGSAAAYRDRFDQWLAQAGDGDLLMCHPAAHGNDGLSQARQIEYAFLRSDAYREMLARHRITLLRLGQSGQSGEGQAGLVGDAGQ
ncbi:MAG: ChbG/HpnK family deacetylase [Massilia sp.]